MNSTKNEQMAMSYRLLVFFLGILGILGSTLILYTTNIWGAGVGNDGVVYITAARFILEGDGIKFLNTQGELIPLTHFPPLYPLLLALIGITGVDLLEGARWLNSILFGANIILVGLLIRAYAPRAFWLPIVGSVIILVSAPMITNHASVQTEPLFLFTSLLGLFFLAKFTETSKWLFLVAAGIAIGLSIFNRYVGIVLIGTAMFELVFFSRHLWYHRIKHAILFGVISFFPMALWILRGLLVGSNPTNRTIEFHALALNRIQQALYTLSVWLVPINHKYFDLPSIVKYVLFGVMLLVIGGGIFWLVRTNQISIRSFLGEQVSAFPFLRVLIAFIVLYYTLILVSVSFFDPLTPLRERILLPVFMAGVIIVLLLWQRVSTRIVTQRLFVTTSAVFCLLFLGGHAATAGIIAFDHYRNGLDYTSWRHAEILEAAREVPDDVIVYSNRYDALFALHGIHARSLPQKLSDFHQTTSADRSDIFIVYFYDMEDSNRTGWLGSSVVLSEDELIAQLDLHRVAQTTDGAIYVLAANE